MLKWFLMKLKAENGSVEKLHKTGNIESAVKDAEKDEKKVYEMYYAYEEPVNKIVPHRVLGIKPRRKGRYSSVSLSRI